LQGLGQLLGTIDRVKSGLNPTLGLLGVVITLSSRTNLAAGVKSELQKHFGEKLFKSAIPRNVRLAEAPSYGEPIERHDRWSRGAKAYRNLTKELLTRLERR
jgi:chromosome partitioning protein